MYRGYRKSTCTSINHVVCHGIPSDKPLKEGDIVNVDVTLILDGWHGDSSRMYAVGEIPRRAERLIEVTYEAMMRGIAAIRPGATTGDIGAAIQTFVEAQHMSVVRDFCGHGLGRLFHDEPNIVHVGRPGEGVVLRPGMFFTVEPMINLGRPHVKVLSDGWTAVTRDRSLSAQFEHTVGGDRRRRRDLHAVAQGPRPAALSRPDGADGVAGSATSHCKLRHCRHPERSRRSRVGDAERLSTRGCDAMLAKDQEASGLAEAPRTITAIASACATRFLEAGGERSPTTSCSSWSCSAPFRSATSSRSPRS